MLTLEKKAITLVGMNTGRTPGPPPHDWMHQENRERLTHIEKRIDLLVQALGVLIGTDDLEDEKAMGKIIEFREQHRRFMIYDKQFTGLAEAIGKWIIRAMATFVIASSIWALSNLEIVRQIWQSKH